MAEKIVRKAEEEETDSEPEQKQEPSSDEPMVYIKLTKPLGAHPAGDCIAVNADLAEHLIEAGAAEHATEEDVQQQLTGEEETEEEQVPEMVASSLKDFEDKVEKATAKAVAKAMGPSRSKAVTLPAEIKQPIYKSEGAYLADCVRVLAGIAPRGQSLAELQKKTRAHEASAVVNSYGEDFVSKAPPLGINETTPAQGGFLVNPQFSSDVYTIPKTQINLQDMAPVIPATSNLLNYRSISENSIANGSIFGGLNMVAVTEGNSFTSSMPAWMNTTLQLVKFVTFVYLTVEELQDVSYPLERDLSEYVSKAFLYGLNSQIIAGTSLEGLNNCPGTVTVTASTNDTSWTTDPTKNLTYADLVNIWARVWPDSKGSSSGVWLYNPALDASLNAMTYTFGASANTPPWGITYNAEDGRSGEGGGPLAPYRLFGKPMYPCFAMAQAGTAGDIGFFDFAQVRTFRKDFRVERSTEFQFGTDQIAVRYVARLDCKGLFRAKVTGPVGPTQYSSFVIRGASGT